MRRKSNFKIIFCHLVVVLFMIHRLHITNHLLEEENISVNINKIFFLILFHLPY